MNSTPPRWHRGTDGAWWYWDGALWTARIPSSTRPRTLRTNLADPRTRPWAISLLACTALTLVLLGASVGVLPGVAAGLVSEHLWLQSALPFATVILAALSFLVHHLAVTSDYLPDTPATTTTGKTDTTPNG